MKPTPKPSKRVVKPRSKRMVAPACRIASIKEFRDNATKMFRSPDPIFITRHGKAAGFFLPLTSGFIPLELRRQLYSMLIQAIHQQMQEAGLNEEDILADFQDFRTSRASGR